MNELRTDRTHYWNERLKNWLHTKYGKTLAGQIIHKHNIMMIIIIIIIFKTFLQCLCLRNPDLKGARNYRNNNHYANNIIELKSMTVIIRAMGCGDLEWKCNFRQKSIISEHFRGNSLRFCKRMHDSLCFMEPHKTSPANGLLWHDVLGPFWPYYCLDQFLNN